MYSFCCTTRWGAGCLSALRGNCKECALTCSCDEGGGDAFDAPLKQCGLTISNLECCDAENNVVGDACCGTLPYNPTNQTCCNNVTVIEGTDDSLCDCVGVQPCGYVLADEGTIEVEYSAICIYDEDKDDYKNECVKNEDIVGLYPGSYYKKDKVVNSCGCCDASELEADAKIKDDDEDYCVNDSPCLADTDILCDTDVGDEVKVKICKQKKSGGLDTECKEPWWLPGKSGESVYDCGECPPE